MTLTEKQREEFEAKSRPLIEWLNELGHPYAEIHITSDSTTLSEMSVYIPVPDYIKD